MNTFKNQAAQGDLLITRVSELPSGVLKAESNDAEYTVAHSETGHNHVMSAQDVQFYEAANDPFVLHVVVSKPTTLRHKRSFDKHEDITVDRGIYRINRQREYTAEGFRRAAD